MFALAEGTGAARYASALRAAQQAIDPGAMLLDAAPEGITLPAGLARLRRWARAAVPGARHAAATPGGRLLATDLFRTAQIYFDIYGQLMPVEADVPPGIMHWAYPVPLRLEGWRNVYTVHDVIPLTAPALTPIAPARHRRLLHRVAAAADAIVTVSDAARADIAAALPLAGTPVVNCGQGVAGRRGTAALPAGLEAGRYLLVCGSVEPRKNVAAILAAHEASGVAFPLAIVGPTGWKGAPIEAAIARARGVIRLPYADADQLAALIGGACALVMPSLAEGFGLPVIEAMAAGTPVITARGGALEETAGGAALLIDPHEGAELAGAIRNMVQDGALRGQLAARGLANAERFTPALFAGKLRQLYARLAAAGPSL